MGLQLLGLILTGEALLLYFGQMGPLMKTASLGAGLFYAGRFLQAGKRGSAQPRDAKRKRDSAQPKEESQPSKVR